MLEAIALLLSFAGLLLAIQQGIPTFFALLGALALITAAYWRRGHGLPQLVTHMGRGVKQSIGVLSILLLIGGVVAAWLAAGTVPTLVYYGLQLIHPQWFLVSALP